MFCPNCGKENQENAAFCEFCGKGLTGENKSSMGRSQLNSGMIIAVVAIAIVIVGMLVVGAVMFFGRPDEDEGVDKNREAMIAEDTIGEKTSAVESDPAQAESEPDEQAEAESEEEDEQADAESEEEAKQAEAEKEAEEQEKKTAAGAFVKENLGNYFDYKSIFTDFSATYDELRSDIVAYRVWDRLDSINVGVSEYADDPRFMSWNEDAIYASYAGNVAEYNDSNKAIISSEGKRLFGNDYQLVFKKKEGFYPEVFCPLSVDGAYLLNYMGDTGNTFSEGKLKEIRAENGEYIVVYHVVVMFSDGGETSIEDEIDYTIKLKESGNSFIIDSVTEK